jgi:hypothetical protein
VIDHGHIPGLDPGDELLRPTIDPCPPPRQGAGSGRTTPKQLRSQRSPFPGPGPSRPFLGWVRA